MTGEFDRDKKGNPVLKKKGKGHTDLDGNTVNKKGYLVDKDGNVIDKNENKVFKKNLLEPSGEIPKVFRSGILRSES